MQTYDGLILGSKDQMGLTETSSKVKVQTRLEEIRTPTIAAAIHIVTPESCGVEIAAANDVAVWCVEVQRAGYVVEVAKR
jgi:hypothetical protein